MSSNLSLDRTEKAAGEIDSFLTQIEDALSGEYLQGRRMINIPGFKERLSTKDFRVKLLYHAVSTEIDLWFVGANKNKDLSGTEYDDWKRQSTDVGKRIVGALSVGMVYAILRRISHILDDSVKHHPFATGGLFANDYLKVMPQYSFRLFAIFSEIVAALDEPFLWTEDKLIRFQLIFYLTRDIDDVYQVHHIKDCLIEVKDWTPFIISLGIRMMWSFFLSTPRWYFEAAGALVVAVIDDTSREGTIKHSAAAYDDLKVRQWSVPTYYPRLDKVEGKGIERWTERGTFRIAGRQMKIETAKRIIYYQPKDIHQARKILLHSQRLNLLPIENCRKENDTEDEWEQPQIAEHLIHASSTKHAISTITDELEWDTDDTVFLATPAETDSDDIE